MNQINFCRMWLPVLKFTCTCYIGVCHSNEETLLHFFDLKQNNLPQGCMPDAWITFEHVNVNLYLKGNTIIENCNRFMLTKGGTVT